MFWPRSSRNLADEYRSGGGPECRIPSYASGSAGGIARSIRVQHSDTCEPVRVAFVHRTVTIRKVTANVVDIGHLTSTTLGITRVALIKARDPGAAGSFDYLAIIYAI
jgi:hypothetical protein